MNGAFTQAKGYRVNQLTHNMKIARSFVLKSKIIAKSMVALTI